MYELSYGLRVLVPFLVRATVLGFICYAVPPYHPMQGGESKCGGHVFLAAAVAIACYLWTDFLLTHWKREYRMVDMFVCSCVFLYTGFCVMGAQSSPWGSWWGFICVDTLALYAFLSGYQGYEKFYFCVVPTLYREALQTARERDEQAATESLKSAEREAARRCAHREALVAAARREVARYYLTHAALLNDSLPPALFRSSLKAAIPDGTDPIKAWAAARQLIEKMHPLVVRATEVRRQDDERRRQAEKEAQQKVAKLDALRRRLAILAERSDDEAREERTELQRKIARLRGVHSRRTITPDDLL